MIGTIMALTFLDNINMGFVQWMATIGVGISLFVILFIMRSFRMLIIARIRGRRLVRVFLDDGHEVYENADFDSLNMHHSKIFKDAVWGPLSQGRHTKMFGVAVYNVGVHNTVPLKIETAIGVQRVMDITKTPIPEVAMAKFYDMLRKLKAIEYIEELAKVANVDKLEDIELSIKKQIRVISKPVFNRLQDSIQACHDIAKENSLYNSKTVTIQKLVEVKTKYDVITKSEIVEQMMKEGREWVQLNLPAIIRDYKSSVPPRDLGSFYLAAEQEGMKQASTEYDIQRIEQWRRTFIWMVIGGMGILAMIGMAIFLGPLVAKEAGSIIGDSAGGLSGLFG